MDTLYTKMRQAAVLAGNKTAISFYGRKYSFNKILDLTDRAANGLKRMGIKKGSVVTLCMPNTPSAQIAFYALNKLGAIVSLVHPYISASGIDKSIKDTKSCLLIAYDLFLNKKGRQLSLSIPVLKSKSDYFMSLLAKLAFKYINRKEKSFNADLFEDLFTSDPDKEEAAAFLSDEAAVYLPSGGTTDRPKTIMHNCEVFNKLCSHASYFLSEPLVNYNAMYSVLPIFHGFGLCMNMHMCATIGVKNVMSIKFSPKAMAKAIKKEGVNVITGVPAMYEKLLGCKAFTNADLKSIKDCFVGGDSGGKKLIRNFNDALIKGGSNARLYEGYGLTETVTVCTVGCSNHNKDGSVGYPLPDTKLKIIKDEKEVNSGEIGEICISTPLLMLGYLPDCTIGTKNSVDDNPIKMIDGEKWLFSGDLGYVDKDGFLFFKQRIKSMIKISGIPVFPSEIEEVVENIQGVIRAAALPFDENGSQKIKLFVESKEGDTASLKNRILAECRQKLIPYAVPKIVEIRQSLPLNAIGKIDRKKL